MELIKIETSESGQHVVSGRELHKFLEVRTEYRHWFPRMVEYGFREGIDYNPVIFDRLEKTGFDDKGTPKQEHLITIQMAQEIAMIQRTEKGKQARQYFIEAEKTLKKIVNKNIIADAKDKRIIELTRDLSEAVKHSEKVIKTVDETMENLRGELEEVLKKETREAVNEEIEKEIHNQVIVAVTRTVAERFAVYIDKLNRLGDWIENHKVIEDVETLKKRVTELEKEIRTIKKSNK